jgi:hypothetical protein
VSERVLGSPHHSEVLPPIVLTIAVSVMHLLLWKQGTAKHPLCDEPMLSHAPSTRNVHDHVALDVKTTSTRPVRMALSLHL